MKNLQDPRKNFESADFSDAPTNKTGKGQDESDWDEIRPGNGEDDFGNEEADWEDEYDNYNPERYD